MNTLSFLIWNNSRWKKYIFSEKFRVAIAWLVYKLDFRRFLEPEVDESYWNWNYAEGFMYNNFRTFPFQNQSTDDTEINACTC